MRRLGTWLGWWMVLGCVVSRSRSAPFVEFHVVIKCDFDLLVPCYVLGVLYAYDCPFVFVDGCCDGCVFVCYRGGSVQGSYFLFSFS